MAIWTWGERAGVRRWTPTRCEDEPNAGSSRQVRTASQKTGKKLTESLIPRKNEKSQKSEQNFVLGQSRPTSTFCCFEIAYGSLAEVSRWVAQKKNSASAIIRLPTCC